MLLICQDKPISLVRCSLRLNSFNFSLFSAPLVSQLWQGTRRAVMSAYINTLKSVLFLMALCEFPCEVPPKSALLLPPVQDEMSAFCLNSSELAGRAILGQVTTSRRVRAASVTGVRPFPQHGGKPHLAMAAAVKSSPVAEGSSAQVAAERPPAPTSAESPETRSSQLSVVYFQRFQ